MSLKSRPPAAIYHAYVLSIAAISGFRPHNSAGRVVHGPDRRVKALGLVHQCINSHKMNNQFILISIKLRY